MAICQDPRLTYLNQFGYTVVRTPRKGIKPLGIVGHDQGSASYLGTLDQIWETSQPVPVPGLPNPFAALSGTKTSDIKISFGLDILANALSGFLGGAAPSLKASYNAAKSIQFQFTDVQSVSVDPFLVGNYLASGDLKQPNPFVERFFGPDATAFVITDILQSKSISATAKASNGTDISLEVDAIKKMLGGKVGVSTSGSNNTQVTYSGTDELTFGVKLFGIGISNGVWQIHGVKPSGEQSFAAADTGVLPDSVVLVRNGFLDLTMGTATGA